MLQITDINLRPNETKLNWDYLSAMANTDTNFGVPKLTNNRDVKCKGA